MKNCKCLIINQAQTSGFLTKIVEFNLARIPILITSNYYQAKSLEEYGVFYKDIKYLSNYSINRLLNKKYKLFKNPKYENQIFPFIYN